MAQRRRVRVRKAAPCLAYWRGHNTHWIEAINYLRQAERSLCTVEHLGADQFLITTSERAFAAYHHNPDRLLDGLKIARHQAAAVTIALTYPTLFIPYDRSTGLFSLSLEPLTACNVKYPRT
jgi:hypothetical protein